MTTEEIKKTLETERREVNQMIVNEIDGLKTRQDGFDRKLDKMNDTVHNIDKSVSKIALLFESQVPQCQTQFFEVKKKQDKISLMAIDNKDKIAKFKNNIDGGRTVFNIFKNVVLPVATFIGGIIATYVLALK